jgi:hypothetical protein
MSVPNTDTFSFQDVTTEIYGDTSAGRNLTQAFADATGVFDSSYAGSKNNLLNFRNYVHIPNDIRLILHTVSVNTGSNEFIDYEFVIQNGTAYSNSNLRARITNTTRTDGVDGILVVYLSASYANSSYTVTSSTRIYVTNTVGDSFTVELSYDNGSTWTGTIQAYNTLTLNYDWIV